MSTSKKLFCFGYGYSCDYLGHELMRRGGWSVAGTTRDEDKVEVLRARGVNATIFERDRPLADPYMMLEGTTHLIISTPPGDEGDPAFLAHMHDILKVPTIEWVGYLSTTGVYGDRGGADVDETAELRPTSKRGSRRVKAEEQWRSLLDSHDLPVHFFRLSGIYGPGRSALDSVRAGVARRINKPNHAFGRIHVEDIVGVLLASIENPAPGQVYNLCDNQPAPSHEVIAYACELLKRPPPPMVEFEDADLSPMARSFYMDNRRVQNAKLTNDLAYTLKYPNFRSGLEGCLEAEDYVVSLFKGMEQK